MSDSLTTMLAAQYPPDHLVARVAALERERDAAIRERDALHADLTRVTAERDALLTAAAHGMSIMLCSSDGDGRDLRLYHDCEGCEAALRVLQARGIYTDAMTASEYAARAEGGK